MPLPLYFRFALLLSSGSSLFFLPFFHVSLTLSSTCSYSIKAGSLSYMCVIPTFLVYFSFSSPTKLTLLFYLDLVSIPGFLESKVYSASLLAALLARSSSDSTSFSTGSVLPSRAKGLGARSDHFNATNPGHSVHVHVEREIEVERAREGELFGQTPMKSPYSVAFEDGASLEEKGGLRGY
jgi:hypothetical protein